jgi:hypothetical protein
MILPGTYIEVRSEGLLGIAGLATGNVGVVGTASKGPVDKFVVLGSYSEALEIFGAYDVWQTGGATAPLSLTRTLEQVFRGGASTVYAVRVANGTPVARKWDVTEGAGGAVLFTLEASSPGTWANAITVNIDEKDGVFTLELVNGPSKTRFTGKNAGELYAAVAENPRLVVASGLASADKAKLPKKGAVAQTVAGGPDGANATSVEVAKGLDAIAGESVQIVVVGGLAAKDVAGVVLGHLESTESDGNERIAVLGASSDDIDTLLGADTVSDDRVVLVAPGIVATDAASTADNRQVKLSGPYAAAAVAGRLASLSPHVSLTNKSLAIDGLTALYSRAQQKRLLQNRVCTLSKNLGYRVLQGISTDTGAYKQISVRRIVDYAKQGVRKGANSYIGRLNNSRVRAALKATLDGFLAGMVQDEMLTGYSLDVYATRAQEIAGQAIVELTLQPTFSIDYIKVIITLA